MCWRIFSKVYCEYMGKLSKAKKIIFPFFKADKHTFLAEKWWFRLITVLYIIGVVILLFRLWDSFSYSSWGWCYDSSSVYFESGDSEALQKHFDLCGKLLTDNRLYVIGGGILATLVIHYLVQLIFFKIIINFIVLGGKHKQSSDIKHV